MTFAHPVTETAIIPFHEHYGPPNHSTLKKFLRNFGKLNNQAGRV